MKSTTREDSASYVLRWSVSGESSVATATASGPTLTLEYEMEALEEIFITDRLWVTDKAGDPIPDPFGVYRFVHDGSLRLVLAQAPSPSNVDVLESFRPHCSRIQAGEVRRVAIPIGLPVDEYSSLSRNVAEPTVAELVSKVHFVLGIRRRSDMDADGAPPPREMPDGGYLVGRTTSIVSTCETEGIPVRRRTGYMPRYPLPGEPGPGPMPLH